MSVLSRPYFHDEAAAFTFVENIVWPNGPVCSHCGGTERIYPLQGVRSGKSKKNPEGVVRHGLKKCGQCRGQFTIRIGTIFEESKLPLTKWLQAIFLMTASKKGVSAHQLHRTLEVTYKTAWFLAHRIREAMRDGELAPFGGNGGNGGMVEVDETYIGQNPDYSIFKRGMKGVYQHCAKKHLHRYAAEFDFRYSHRIANGFDDTQRATKALAGVVGKRLTYRRPDGGLAAPF
jgi:transposase-like protein